MTQMRKTMRLASNSAGQLRSDTPSPRVTTITCVKNEGPFLLEWIAYHRLIGVTDFLFYSNDCSDGTTRLLDALAERELVTHLPNPATGRAYQMEALKDARRHSLVQNADWVWIADVDEFLNIHVGQHTISDLIAACGSPQAISVNFQFFANNGVTDYVDNPVIAQFTRSHNPDLWATERAIEVKTLTKRNFPLKYYGAHRPFLRDGPNDDTVAHWTDGSGRPVSDRFRTAATQRRIRAFRAKGARQFATLNHYALRSVDSYLVKSDRGDVNREGRAFDAQYWRERNDPAWEDRSIQRHLPALEAEIAALKTDAEVAHLHNACVTAHMARRDALLRDPAMRELRADLASVPTLPEAELELAQNLRISI